MDELNPTVREQEIYEQMELTPEMLKSIRPSVRPVCGTLWMQRLSRSHLYPAQTGAWTPAPSARCGAATIMWSCTTDPTIPPYLKQSPLRNIRRRALHITTWRYNFAAKLEIPTRRHLLHPFRGEHRLGTAR